MTRPTQGQPGHEQGKHIIEAPGVKIPCNCGGCKDGKRIQQKPRIIALRGKEKDGSRGR